MSLQGRGVFDYIVKDPGAVAQMSTVIMSSFLLGSLTILALVTAFFLVRKGLRRTSIRIQLLAIAILYASTCVYFAVSVAYYVNVYSWDTVSLYSPMRPLSTSGWGENVQKAQSWIFSATLTINISVADAVVWWRACAVWRVNRYVLIGSVSVVTATLVLGSISTYMTSLSGDGFALNEGGDRGGLDIYGTACFFVLFISNVVSTSLIGYKAWVYRKVLRESLNSRTRTSRAMTILSLLIESGTGYSLIWLVFAICYAYLYSIGGTTSGPGVFPYVYDVISGGATVYLVATYPMLVVVLVNINQSQLDAWQAVATPTSSMRFADVGNSGQHSTTVRGTHTRL